MCCAVDEHGCTLLHHAARDDRIDLLATLLTRGAVVNPVNHLGLTPMAEAALAGCAAAAAVMQTRGGARTGLLHSSFYKLHAAVMNVDVAAVQKELEGGADPDLADFQSATPLHVAVAVSSSEIVKVLLAAGANPNSQNRSGTTPLQLALMSEQPAIVELLQAAGGEVNPKHLSSCWRCLRRHVQRRE
jgi:ankyrin repeat protein